MKLDSLNINKFILSHACKEVTNPVYFNSGAIPTEDGLFSHEIFGRPGSKERKIVFAYIDLKKMFVHPAYYKLFISMDKKIQELLTCKNRFKVNSEGQLEVDEENGKNGVSYFYEIYEKLKFKQTGSDRRKDYLKLLSNSKKTDIFLDKYLVIPPFLRDYNPSKTDSSSVKDVDVVNDMYANLIRMSKTINKNDSYNFMGAMTESNIQQTLYEIYDYFTNKLSGKTGMIHQSLLGKNTDYATRSVISAPRINSNYYQDMKIRFGYTGVPLSQIVVLFYPFFVKYIQEYIYEREHEISSFEYEGKLIEIKNIKEQFSEDRIKKMIALFIKSTESRFNTLKVKDKEGNEYPINLFRKELERNFTVTDLLFIAAKDICATKHVYITRYPVESYQNIYPSKITILSTKKLAPVTLEDRYLPDYPMIIPDYPCKSEMFYDITMMHNSYLQSLGADYDGCDLIIF